MPSKRGFAAMSPERRRRLQQKGAQKAIERGTIYKFSKEENSRGGKGGSKKQRETSPSLARKPYVLLNNEQIAEIKRRYIAGETQSALAADFKVTKRTIFNIVNERASDG